MFVGNNASETAWATTRIQWKRCCGWPPEHANGARRLRAADVVLRSLAGHWRWSGRWQRRVGSADMNTRTNSILQLPARWRCTHVRQPLDTHTIKIHLLRNVGG